MLNFRCDFRIDWSGPICFLINMFCVKEEKNATSSIPGKEYCTFMTLIPKIFKNVH